jgi:predicted nuclease of restriction endonuclease-like (RecB) superfamily
MNEIKTLQNNAYSNIRSTVIVAKSKVYSAINFAMVEAYWEIGREIIVAQGDIARAQYGKGLLTFLAIELTKEFGKGFEESNLRKMRQFYSSFPIRDTLCPILSWSHYRLLMRIEDTKKRDFYLKECADSNWSVRQLERQITTFFYERLLATQNEQKDIVRNEIQILEPKNEADFILKDPYILEFLDLKGNKAYLEKDIEQGLIDNLQEFLLELGKGFSFVARQKRITVDGDHFYIDLVFYNYILKCFVLIDLKTGKLTHQDIGQIDFYVRYFEKEVKSENDNPTMRIVLCSDKNDTMVKYSVLEDNNNLFASKYMLYIPTEEELKKEITRERRIIEQNLLDGE